MIKEPTKAAFQNTWPGGYSEQFEVYTRTTGDKEEDIVNTCLVPFYNPEHTALDIGCGHGFWSEKYLLPNFMRVTGIDLIPLAWTKVRDPRFTYIEVPSRDYSCFGVGDNSIDFVWSFGCFCHIPTEANAAYVKSAFRVLKPGGQTCLFFANDAGRPGAATKLDSPFDPEKDILWSYNDWPTAEAMMEDAGFVDIKNMLPKNKDLFVYGRKP